MTSSGFLIRFIDIGLILLFGFVQISEIDTVSQVELSAVAGARRAAEDDTGQAFVTVAIAADGTLTLADPASGRVMASSITRVEVLTEVLRRLKADAEAAQQHLVVLINPDDHSTVQRTVDVMDVCDRLGVRKSLQTVLGSREGA